MPPADTPQDRVSEKLAEIEARHCKYRTVVPLGESCRGCHGQSLWPCDAIRLVRAVRAAREAGGMVWVKDVDAAILRALDGEEE